MIYCVGKFTVIAFAFVTVLTGAVQSSHADPVLRFPLDRSAYQTNETIDLDVIRLSNQSLSPGQLELTVTGDDASRLKFVFPTGVGDGSLHLSEHLHLNARLLRPGNYHLKATVDGSTSAELPLEVVSHVRKSSFRLIDWGAATGDEQSLLGEDGLGYNLYYGAESGNSLLRGGVDDMLVDTMGGAHQMDMRVECDWSDPYVTRGGTARVVLQALRDRTRANVVGVHFYDEPGLTYARDPQGSGTVPHGVPTQIRSYRAAFGQPPIDWHRVDGNNPNDAAAWEQWGKWKLGFLNSAWKEANFGLTYARRDYLGTTQSQYGWNGFADGYYFNVVASLPVISGHGGYDDYGLGYLNPSWYLEMARSRDYSRACWYLPVWDGGASSDRYRGEQNLCFITNIQGVMSGPDLEPVHSPRALQGIVETNRLFARLGTIFNTTPVTHSPVVMLYSISGLLHEEALDRHHNYTNETRHGVQLGSVYLAGKLLQRQIMPVLDEDIIDGSLAAQHAKVVILPSLQYTDPAVVTGLEKFIASGGTVLKEGDCRVDVKGAIDLGVAPPYADSTNANMLNLGEKLDAIQPLVKSLGAALDKAGVPPIFTSDEPGIVASRQAAGDVEYIFAVNAKYDRDAHDMITSRRAVATLSLPDDGRPIYDAVTGGIDDSFKVEAQAMKAHLRFGTGEMRAWARTARPIGGIKTGTPVVTVDYTAKDQPIQLQLSAALLDNRGALLSGSVPLRIQVIDPLQDTRYDLYRATCHGIVDLTLPLAANDAAGRWRVVITELLANTADESGFDFQPAGVAGTIAGRTSRAVMFEADRENIFRFARLHQSITIVKGSSEFNNDPAERLASVLKPWGVSSRIVPASEVAASKPLTSEQARTWIGLTSGEVAHAGGDNSPEVAGFNVEGPVVLLGTPQDNPLIDFVSRHSALPYKITADFPGTGRGYLAWQRDMVGKGQESITVIASDATGMSEAIGSLYEVVAGMDPLTSYELPSESSLQPATAGQTPRDLRATRVARVNDRVIAIGFDGTDVTVISNDGSSSRLADGKPLTSENLDEAVLAKAIAANRPVKFHSPASKPYEMPRRIVKLIAEGEQLTAVGYWGGLVQLFDSEGHAIGRHVMPADVTAIAWNKTKLLVGLANGQVLALEPRS